MFEILPESHDNRIALKASGKLTHADYQNLTPLLETQIAKSGPISALMDMEDFAGMELRAARAWIEA
jgi:universal stress protein A